MADSEILLLGVDGGGTRCRARLVRTSGETLAEGGAGPANLRLGLDRSFAAVLDAARQCFALAGLGEEALSRTVACLALAGASEPNERAAAAARPLPFRHVTIATDAHAACIGAHRGHDGGIVVIGTGSIGWAMLGGAERRVGGWGWPLSDEGSGAWLGAEALRRVLWAHDGRIGWTALLDRLFGEFDRDPHAVVRWTGAATPGDFARFAPAVVEGAESGDPAGVELLREAALHVEAILARLVALGAQRLALVGGLARRIEPWLGPEKRFPLVPPAEDALAGALRLARADAAALR